MQVYKLNKPGLTSDLMRAKRVRPLSRFTRALEGNPTIQQLSSYSSFYTISSLTHIYIYILFFIKKRNAKIITIT